MGVELLLEVVGDRPGGLQAGPSPGGRLLNRMATGL
jgi:hypothetical protein